MAPRALGLRTTADTPPKYAERGELHTTTINKRHPSPAVVLRWPAPRSRPARSRSPGNAQSASHAAAAILRPRSGSTSGVLHLQARCRLVAQKAWARTGGEGRSRRAGEAAGVWWWGVAASSPSPGRWAVAAPGVDPALAVRAVPSGGGGAAA